MRIILITYYWLFIFTSFSFGQEPPPRDLVLHLNFNGRSLVDQSPNRHFVIGHNISFEEGVEEEGLVLSGRANTFIEVATSPTLLIPNEVTTSVWYQHQDQPPNGFYSLVEQSADEFGGHSRYGTWAVSYTHLTLPTICSV